MDAYSMEGVMCGVLYYYFLLIKTLLVKCLFLEHNQQECPF